MVKEAAARSASHDTAVPALAGPYDRRMTDAAEALLRQALRLPVEDRALLVSGLLASLDDDGADDDSIEDLWSSETERRARTMESVEATPGGWDHVTTRIDEGRS